MARRLGPGRGVRGSRRDSTGTVKGGANSAQTSPQEPRSGNKKMVKTGATGTPKGDRRTPPKVHQRVPKAHTQRGNHEPATNGAGEGGGSPPGGRRPPSGWTLVAGLGLRRKNLCVHSIYALRMARRNGQAQTIFQAENECRQPPSQQANTGAANGGSTRTHAQEKIYNGRV